jgi:hypothetical protein
MDYDDEQINKLIKSYYGEINENIISRVNLQGVVSDIGWSLWNYVQAKNIWACLQVVRKAVKGSMFIPMVLPM